MTHFLVIENWVPVLTNLWYGRHWRVRHKLKRDQADLLRAEAIRQNIPRAPGPRLVQLHVYGWPRGRVPDADAFDKLLLDGLVTAGLLTDDGQSGLIGRMSVSIVRAKEKRTIITLKDCENSETAEEKIKKAKRGLRPCFDCSREGKTDHYHAEGLRE